MDVAFAVWVVIGVVLALFLLVLYVKTGKPVRAFLGTAVPGALSLAIINYTSFFTGVGLAVNTFTVYAAVFLGLPGVISVFLLKLLWGIS